MSGPEVFGGELDEWRPAAECDWSIPFGSEPPEIHVAFTVSSDTYSIRMRPDGTLDVRPRWMFRRIIRRKSKGWRRHVRRMLALKRRAR